jgi:N utilization substance protein B
MLRKRKTRELAMQAMFLWDSNAQQDTSIARQIIEEETPDTVIIDGAMRMALGAWEQREAIDRRVEHVAPQWPPRRQPAVDRNLIRLAVWELTNADTPPKVVIDEAIELAKQYSTEQSPAFVNGVLDAILKEHETLIAAPGTTPTQL